MNKTILIGDIEFITDDGNGISKADIYNLKKTIVVDGNSDEFMQIIDQIDNDRDDYLIIEEWKGLIETKERSHDFQECTNEIYHLIVENLERLKSFANIRDNTNDGEIYLNYEGKEMKVRIENLGE